MTDGVTTGPAARTPPTEWRSPTGEVFVLAEVPKILRSAAVTIAFGMGRGPWWEALPVARQVLSDHSNDLRLQMQQVLYGTARSADGSER